MPELSDYDKAAMRETNRILNEYLAGLAGSGFVSYSGLKHADGQPVQFDLGPGKHTYLYYEDKQTKARYCYTPWKCTRGWYWAFNYAPRGRGSRSGDPEKLVIVDGVKFRKRKTAKARAYARWSKATGNK
jgi:hypothetical protein